MPASRDNNATLAIVRAHAAACKTSDLVPVPNAVAHGFTIPTQQLAALYVGSSINKQVRTLVR